ncbi:cobalamin B12-binding domain-containing protein [Streptomyces sp. NPDC059063]|uniref:cobalamin B12-binding domain-containing protein n=1 Tax=unclassified Streptomyces TaxID=2593676 RepID=UPI0036C3352C
MDRIRVVMAKPGLDSHYRGTMVVSRYLVQEGMEVVYVGNQTSDQIVRAVLAEDADVLGLSSLSGNHLVTVPPVLDGLRALGLDDVMVLVGGIVPSDDAEALRAAGVHEIFGPGTELAAIAASIRGFVERRAARFDEAACGDEAARGDEAASFDEAMVEGARRP